VEIFLQYLVNGLIKGSIYVLPAIGVSMIFGMLGIINFAQGEIYMLGAVVAFTAASVFGQSYLVGLVLAVIVMAAFGLLFERVVIRPMARSGLLNTVIATLAAAMILENGALKFWSTDPQILPSPYVAQIISLGSLTFSVQQLIMFVVSIILTGITHLFVSRSTLGWAITAVSQDPDAASLMGIETNRVIAITFIVGSVLAAIGGVLIGPMVLVYPAMGRITGLKVIAAVILGGAGSVPGAFVGGLTLGVIEALMSGYISTAYKDAAAFIIVILVMLLRPSGLFGQRIS
jgi:branched-chain amino acid transport system permease protein